MKQTFRYRGKEAKSISESIHFINSNISLIFDLAAIVYLGDHVSPRFSESSTLKAAVFANP